MELYRPHPMKDNSLLLVMGYNGILREREIWKDQVTPYGEKFKQKCRQRDADGKIWSEWHKQYQMKEWCCLLMYLRGTTELS